MLRRLSTVVIVALFGVTFVAPAVPTMANVAMTHVRIAPADASGCC
jgi:hypothetical protein